MFKKAIQQGHIVFVQFIVMTLIGFAPFISFASSPAPSYEGIQLYQKNLQSSPEHIQKLADDVTRYRNADNLWDVLRQEFTLQHYENTPAVQEKIDWYMNNQDFLLRAASRAAPYLYYILQQVKKRHLPAELVLLPIVESGYNPFAISNVGASGIWQIMPDTANDLGIQKDWGYDGRRDVIASTRGALNHLMYLESFFAGNWLLAIAAYNTGEGNVLAAIRRNIRDGKDTDFWSLPVAQQTKDYVPSILALATIISHPDQYPIYFPPVRNAPYLAQVDVGTKVNLKLAASLAGISFAKVTQLNPGVNHSTSGLSKLILPIENVQQFSENLARSPLHPQIDWIHYRVKSGDTLAAIAKRFNTSPTSIQRLNHLAHNNFRHGMDLVIPNTTNDSSDDQSIMEASSTSNRDTKFLTISNDVKKIRQGFEEASNTTQVHQALQPGDTIYMVRNNDTLDSIARRFHINASNIRAANHLSYRTPKPGVQIVIPTHLVTQQASAQSNFNNLSAGDTIYMVRHGDTIAKIAHRFHTSASAIRLTNFVDDNSLSEGEKLVIPTHLRG